MGGKWSHWDWHCSRIIHWVVVVVAAAADVATGKFGGLIQLQRQLDTIAIAYSTADGDAVDGWDNIPGTGTVKCSFWRFFFVTF